MNLCDCDRGFSDSFHILPFFVYDMMGGEKGELFGVGEGKDDGDCKS